MLEAIASGQGTVRNVLRGRRAAGDFFVLDYRMPPGARATSSNRFSTCAAYPVPGVPTFQLFRRPRFAIGMTFLDFDEAPGFSRRFALLAADEGEVRRSFTPAVLAACEALPRSGVAPQRRRGLGVRDVRRRRGRRPRRPARRERTGRRRARDLLANRHGHGVKPREGMGPSRRTHLGLVALGKGGTA